MFFQWRLGVYYRLSSRVTSTTLLQAKSGDQGQYVAVRGATPTAAEPAAKAERPHSQLVAPNLALSDDATALRLQSVRRANPMFDTENV
eukprot:m.500983 g.500983  ORF g.500983 m.500983 type:complete len:89 (-) comp21837_c0_seq4:211-477(-)